MTFATEWVMLLAMSDDLFDDEGPLDESFFHQMDTLEQHALSQQSNHYPNKRARLEVEEGAEGSRIAAATAQRPRTVAEAYEAEGDRQNADLAMQWEQALEALEAENQRVWLIWM